MPAPRLLVALWSFLVLSAAPALAQVPAQLRACIQQGSQQTRIIGDGDSCKPTETLVFWNIQGPKGEKGDPGTPGPKGDKGDNAASGVIVGRIVSCAPDGSVIGAGATLFATLGFGYGGLSDSDGRFTLYVRPGTYRLGPPPVNAGPFTVGDGQTVDAGDIQTVNFMTNPFNCGACGIHCGPAETCTNGVCTAPVLTCSGHGAPGPAPGTCICDAGWTGPNCDVPAGVTCVPPNVLCPGTTTCVPSISFCAPPTSCPAPGFVCPPESGLTAGRCVISLSVCPVACASPAVTCADGFCANSFAECATHTVCLPGETRCADGRCVLDAGLCAGTCPAGQTSCSGTCVTGQCTGETAAATAGTSLLQQRLAARGRE